MIKLFSDFHIHSCLSPCADMEMTPNNLVNMAYLKGLEAIAVCDHNTTGNLIACKAVADFRGLVFIPGMEVETKEEVHVLTLFPDIDAAMDFGKFVYSFLPDIPNMPDFFGAQTAMDADDESIYEERRMLIQSTTLSIDELVVKCREAGGVPIPSHINRTSNSLLASLGFIPEGLDFCSVEVYRHLPVTNVDVSDYHVLYNSDAHRLDDILEREQAVSAYDKSPAGILKYLDEHKRGD